MRVVALLGLVVLLPACGVSGGGTLNPTVAPGIPTNLIVRAGNHSATLTWSTSVQSAQFTVLRALLPGGPFFPAGSGQFRTPTTYVDANLANGTPYYYEVVSSNSFGESAPSTVASTTPGFKAMAVSAGSLSGNVMALLQDGSVWTWGTGTTFGGNDLPAQVPGIADVTAIACGTDHFLALKNDGTVWAWGNDTLAQLGDGQQPHNPTSVPAPVLDLEGIVAIAAGGQFSLAVGHDGTVWAWGDNTYGQLGTGSTSPAFAPTPQAVPGLASIVGVSAGAEHGLAVRSDGLMFAWGNNASGQLGNGTMATGTFAPAEVQNLTGVASVSAGSFTSLALRGDGSVWAWGDNASRELGVASSSSTIVVPTAATTPGGVVEITAGFHHSLAVCGDGSIWGWGDNTYGQLGIGTGAANPVVTPTRVQTIATGVMAAASSQNSVAMGSDGTVWTWGDNLRGELGNGSGPFTQTPVQLKNFTGALSIAGGNEHTLALAAPGTLWGWGMDAHGQFGVGATSTIPSAVPARATGITTGLSVASGYEHGLVLLPTGAVLACGENDAGQLGLGSFSSPVVTYTAAATPTGITAIACGIYHSLAIRNDQTLWTWGANGNGQLGNGTTSAGVATPAQVTGLTGVVAAAGGAEHSMAVLSDGSVWAWGDDSVGQLGLGVLNAPQLVPGKVPGISGAVAVAAGPLHTLVLLQDGTVWAWGDNTYGSLGNGTYFNSFVPVQVQGLTGVVSIAAGYEFSLAVRKDGTVWGWGHSDYGQIGNGATGTNTTSPTPVQIPGISGATSVAAGFYHSIAILNNQTVWCWGRNSEEQLGVPYVTMAMTPVVVGN